MNSTFKLASRSFPARVAELGFTADLPVDWVSHELPNEEIDVSNPTVFLPLAVISAPHAAIIFAFAARPAYEDGTVHDWAWYHLNHNKLQPRAVGRDILAGVPAVVGEATQGSEVGPLVVRFAFFEDGNRLLNLTLTAPEAFADSVRDAWFGMLRSFRLETARGSRFKHEFHPDDVSAAPIPEPWLKAKSQESAVSGAKSEPAALESSKKNSFYDFALEADTTSLDPETAINNNLRMQGAGLVPHVVAADGRARRATVAAGAVMAQFDVPYGWHVIDDGKRTLVFEPSGRVQINLNLIPREGRSNKAILDEVEAEMRRDYPQPEFARLKEGKIHALTARNIADGEQALEQYHLLFPFRDESMVLRARVTATPEEANDATNLAEIILESCVFDCFQQRDGPKPVTQTPDGKPLWWHEALAMEAQNQLEAAEKHIHESCPYIGFAYSTAEMYRRRMLRLRAAGDEAGAREAFKKSSDFIFFYASMATSGGEGAALSAERDQFHARLVAESGMERGA